jgi:ABC-type transport system involved in multi-copper enzyme maturation permease subunit
MSAVSAVALGSPGTPDSALAPPTPPTSGPAFPSVERHRISDIRQWGLLTYGQLNHYLRTNRFIGLWAFVVLICALTLGFELQAGIALTQQVQLHRISEYLSNFLVWVGLFIVLAAAFFGGDALSVDFSTGAGYYMLVLPFRRWTLLAGRYVAATVVTLAIVATYFAFGIVGGAYFFGIQSLPWDTIFGAFAISILFTLAALSVAFTISAFFRSPASGVLVTVLATYVGFVTINQTVEFANYEPWWSLTYAGGAMAALLDTDFVHLQTIPVGEDQYVSIWSSTVPEGLVIMLAYLLLFMTLSGILYYRKEASG